MLKRDNEFVYTYKKTLSGSSSAISAVFYNAVDRRMVVVFPNGSKVGYEKVQGFDVAEFVKSKSAGTHYHQYIKKFPAFFAGHIATFVPHNSASDLNESPSMLYWNRESAEKKVVEPVKKTKFEIAFTLEATTVFEADTDNMAEALDQFLGAHKEKNNATVRVRSMKVV